MDQALFDKWFDTIVGQRQIRGALRTEEGYCALGWAVETVYGRDVWQYAGFGLPYWFQLDPEDHLHGRCSMTVPTGDLAALGFNLSFESTEKNTWREGVSTEWTTLGDLVMEYSDAGYSFDFVRRVAAAKLAELLRLEGEGK